MQVTAYNLTAVRAGKVAAPKCDAVPARRCPLCGADAVLLLNLQTRSEQPDATVAVCHPLLGGCNHGFAL